MKNKASTIMKRVISALTAILKAKSMAVKSKASAMKTRLIIFWLLRNKNFLASAISVKIHALMSREKGGASGNEKHRKAVVSHNVAKQEALPNSAGSELIERAEDCDEETQLMFDSDDELGSNNNVGLVGDTEEDGSDFNLEDEIDHMAGEFIKRFRMQMRMEKQDSFKIYEEMMEGSA